MLLQQFHDIALNDWRRPATLPRDSIEDVVDEERNVPRAFSQRRELNHQHLQAV
jgi:hypothetical protein